MPTGWNDVKQDQTLRLLCISSQAQSLSAVLVQKLPLFPPFPVHHLTNVLPLVGQNVSSAVKPSGMLSIFGTLLLF